MNLTNMLVVGFSLIPMLKIKSNYKRNYWFIDNQYPSYTYEKCNQVAYKILIYD